MSGLAVRNKSGELLQYTGTQFEGLENTGTHHLCVRTGAGADDVVKYGLTSAPLNDKYKGLRMRIPDNGGGNGGRDAYIAQRYSTSVSASSARTYTASRVSNYVSSTTLRTASSSKLSTGTATRVSTHAPIYYGSQIVSTFSTNVPIFNSYTTAKTTNIIGKLITYTSATKSYSMAGGVGVNCSVKNQEDGFYRNYSITMTVTNGAYSVTRTQTSRASNYVTSRTLSTASSSKLSTGNATRSSAYNTSSSVSTTSSKLTHNANL